MIFFKKGLSQEKGLSVLLHNYRKSIKIIHPSYPGEVDVDPERSRIETIGDIPGAQHNVRAVGCVPQSNLLDRSCSLKSG
jgi:hypothetical protein